MSSSDPEGEFNARQLLIELESRRTLNWVPQARFSRETFEYLRERLRNPVSLNKHQIANGFGVMFRLRSLGELSTLTGLLEVGLDHDHAVVRSRAAVLLVGLLRVETELERGRYALALEHARKRGVDRATDELVRRFLGQE